MLCFEIIIFIIQWPISFQKFVFAWSLGYSYYLVIFLMLLRLYQFLSDKKKLRFTMNGMFNNTDKYQVIFESLRHF